jgi:alkanesulfonate monooxygenase SsuD/methylene tetrahydromethanopterin reductase-like flavin-dependent oxidoreductase (luciferase family)
MKFGVHFQIPCGPGQVPADRYRDTIDQAVHAEALGYESIWPVEQHFSPASSIVPSPLILLAAIAARTRALRLGTGVILLPLAHPLRVAEDVAALDLLSGGRVDCGVGRGMDPARFAGYGVDQSESAARLEEGVQILRTALTGAAAASADQGGREQFADAGLGRAAGSAGAGGRARQPAAAAGRDGRRLPAGPR